MCFWLQGTVFDIDVDTGGGRNPRLINRRKVCVEIRETSGNFSFIKRLIKYPKLSQVQVINRILKSYKSGG